MAEYPSVEVAAERHQAYPDLRRDLSDHDFQRRRVLSSVQFVRPGDTLLEVACNSGYVREYCPQAAEIHGVDISAELVEKAKLVLDSAQVALAETLPFPDRKFDVVNVSGLLEQVFDPVAVMKEAVRVSRRAVVGNTVHATGTWGKHRTERHAWQARSWSEDEIRALLEPLGTLVYLGTVDINNPPEPQCWVFHLEVPPPVVLADGTCQWPDADVAPATPRVLPSAEELQAMLDAPTAPETSASEVGQ